MSVARERLVSLVTYLMSGEGTEDSQDAALLELQSLVPHPRVSDLIFGPQQEEMSPEQVVDEALRYRPIEL